MAPEACTEIILCERLAIAQFIAVYQDFLRRQHIAVASSKLVNFQNMANLEHNLAVLHKRQELQKAERILLVADGAPCRREKELLIYRVRHRDYLKNCAEFAYYLFPYKSPTGYWQTGYLEDLLLETLLEATAENSHYYALRNIAEDFLLSVDNARGREHRLQNHSRHFLGSYFAGTEKYAGVNMAEAARQGAFALADARFDALQAFLRRA